MPDATDSTWLKIAPILISALGAVTAGLSLAANVTLSSQSQALNQLKAEQEQARGDRKELLDMAASKRADAQVVSTYMTALVSDNPQMRQLALSSVYYALGDDL